MAGLDPAGPLFTLNDTETRLDTTDGDFVDIIHTNGGTLLHDQQGFLPPIGHPTQHTSLLGSSEKALSLPKITVVEAGGTAQIAHCSAIDAQNTSL
jgi:hypothetical protein